MSEIANFDIIEIGTAAKSTEELVLIVQGSIKIDVDGFYDDKWSDTGSRYIVSAKTYEPDSDEQPFGEYDKCFVSLSSAQAYAFELAKHFTIDN